MFMFDCRCIYWRVYKYYSSQKVNICVAQFCDVLFQNLPSLTNPDVAKEATI